MYIDRRDDCVIRVGGSYGNSDGADGETSGPVGQRGSDGYRSPPQSDGVFGTHHRLTMLHTAQLGKRLFSASPLCLA
jgi:hypothetical protein